MATRITAAIRGRSRAPTIRSGSRPARSPRAPRARRRHRTLSHHHQGVDRVGEGLVVTGHSRVTTTCPRRWSSRVRGSSSACNGIPEVDETSKLVTALVDDARERMAERARAGR